jgi:hypothetical protein
MGLSASDFEFTSTPQPAKRGRVVTKLTDDELKGADMPRGVYDRKQKTETDTPTEPKAAKAPKRRKAPIRAARKARTQATEPQFGVFNDGSVQINVPACKGALTRDEASALLGFIQHLNAPR